MYINIPVEDLLKVKTACDLLRSYEDKKPLNRQCDIVTLFIRLT